MFVRALSAMACCAALSAQTATDGVLLLRDSSGGVVTDAQGRFVLEPDAHLVALRGLALPGTALPPREAAATGDARGMLRLHGDEPVAASGLVTTDQGLGALVARLRPRSAQRLVLEPMGALTTHSGSEPFTLWARTTLPTGERLVLPMLQGTEVRLPVGTYEVWAKVTEGFTWQRVDVRSGQRTPLDFRGPRRVLQTAAGTTLHPESWPSLDLLGGDRECALLPRACTASLYTFVAGRLASPRLVPAPDATDATERLAWPPPETRRADDLVIPIADAAQATLLSLRRDAAGAWQVLAASTAADGVHRLPRPPAGDNWLLRLGPAVAPVAAPWPIAAEPVHLPADPGVPLQVVARDATGLPAVDVAVEYVPDGMAAAAVAGHTDGRGIARLGPAHAPGTLHVVDARFANQQLDLATIPRDGLAVTVEAGAALHGTARWPDGSPARGVVVTLRDPRGALRPAVRALASDDDGGFRFTGLPTGRALVLFATTQRNGRTWSAKLDRLGAGGDACTLVLRDEDPDLTPRAR